LILQKPKELVRPADIVLKRRAGQILSGIIVLFILPLWEWSYVWMRGILVKHVKSIRKENKNDKT